MPHRRTTPLPPQPPRRTEADLDWDTSPHGVPARSSRGEDREFYDSLRDSIPTDVPDTVWESDGLSRGAGA